MPVTSPDEHIGTQIIFHFKLKRCTSRNQKMIMFACLYICHMSTFLIYPYKYKYEVNRVLPLLENTQAAVTLGVNTKSDCFTPNSSVTVHVNKQIFPLKGIKYCV